MPLARIAAERVLLFLFSLARSAFLASALATASLLVVALPLRGPEGPPWLEIVTRAWLLIAGTFLATGVLLFAAPHLRAPVEAEDGGRPQRIGALLGLSLVVLPALSYARAGDLVALWREILVLLDEVGLWNAFEGGGANSGLVLLPVLAALFVPALEAAAAFFLIAVPPGLLALLATRSPLLPRIFTMLAVCQAGLVLASLIGADAFSRLATDLIALMSADGDAEVLRAAETLRRAEGVLGATARGFVVPTLAYLAWVPVLLLSRRIVPFAIADAGADLEAARAPAWSPPPIAPLPARPAPIAPAESVAQRVRTPSAGAGRTPDPRARIALVALGSLMLVFAAAEQLRFRARYERSDPAPGATLASAPAAVRVGFGRALDPSSSLWIDRMAPGEAASRVGVSSGLDPDDPDRRTLRADLSAASAGVFRVAWHALPASGGGVARHGSFDFEVGRSTASVSRGVQERDAGKRGRRSTVVGGGLLILLGALLPGLPRLR